MTKKHLQRRERGVPNSCLKQSVPKKDCQKKESNVQRPKGVLKADFVWCIQKLIRNVKVVKYGFNVLNANSELMKLTHLVKRATFVIIVYLTFFGA